jgi:predicted lipoprotein with Yx(FWY)xxD motif
MTRKHLLAITAVVAVVAVPAVAVAASHSSSHSHSRSSAATVSVRKTKLGRVLVNSRGVTLYLFEKDKKGKSACNGACATAWPPLLTKGKPKAHTGVQASKLGTTRRSNRTKQVTYGGHPLYTFVGDRNKPGSTAGEGSKAFGAEWYVLGTNGKKIEKGEKQKTGGY